MSVVIGWPLSMLPAPLGLVVQLAAVALLVAGTVLDTARRRRVRP